MIADRLKLIQPSATLAIASKAAELKAQGKKIISLSTGEPDFDMPKEVKRVAIAAIEDGFNKYTAVDGIAELKEAIINKLSRDQDITYASDQILVSCGAKHSIFNALLALINPGDEVIIPAPYWVSYPDMVRLAEGQPVITTTTNDQRYTLSADNFARKISNKTKLLILNSPCNPTGMAYSSESLQAIAQVLAEHPDVWVLSDDIYEYIHWQQAPLPHILKVAPELAKRTLVINGVSKAYAMTGWRIGYCAGPQPMIQAMKKIQSQSTSCPNGVAQKAAVAALNLPRGALLPMITAFQKRHELVQQTVARIADVEALPADGAFYAWINIERLLTKSKLVDDIDFAAKLLEDAGLAVVPGTAFGAPGHFRLSFALDETNLKEALTRLQQFCQTIG